MIRRIRGAHILTMDPRLGAFPGGDITISADGKIESIASAPNSVEPERAGDVIDARNMIAVPGFVDSHRHVWVTLFRGMTADMTVQGYRQYTKSVLAPRVRPQDVFAGTLLGALEAIDSGITTLTALEHITKTPEHSDASIDALVASGIRAVYAHTPPNGMDNDAWWVKSELSHPDDIRRVRHERLSDGDALVTLAMGMRPLHFLAPGVLEQDVAIGRDLGVRMIFDGIGAAIGGAGRWERPDHRTLRELVERDMLRSDCSFVHCNHAPDSELRLLADHNAHLSIAPEVELLCGYGLPAMSRAFAAGVRPSLSTDIATHAATDMFTAMKAVMGSTRGDIASGAYRRGDDVGPWELTTHDVLESATMSGARFLGLEHRIGSLTPGKDADITLISSDHLNLLPMNDPYASIALLAHPGNVDTVLIKGRAVKRSGRLTSTLASDAITSANASRDFLVGDATPPRTLEAEAKWRF